MVGLWRRGQAGWPIGYPLFQFPNPPLLIAIFGSLATAVELFGTVRIWEAVYLAGIVVWAGLEIAVGANLFRRVLGCAVLVWVALDVVGVR